jgi:predicted outer membrane lipoprotein
MGLLLTVAATVLMAMWVETAQALMQHNPEFPDRLQAFVLGSAPSPDEGSYVAPAPNLDGWSPPVSFTPSVSEDAPSSP